MKSATYFSYFENLNVAIHFGGQDLIKEASETLYTGIIGFVFLQPWQLYATQ